jgi:hypothetical protein
MAGPALRPGFAKSSPNETVNVAVMGIRGQGAFHLKNYPKVPNVNVSAVCDIDERLFPKALAGVEAASGRRPRTYTDIRRMLEDKDIDAVSMRHPITGVTGYHLGCWAGKCLWKSQLVTQSRAQCRLPVSTGALCRLAPPSLAAVMRSAVGISTRAREDLHDQMRLLSAARGYRP